MIYRVFLTPTAKSMLAAITKPYRSTLLKRVCGLKTDPEKQGIALVASLKGYRRLRVGRYRVIYQVRRSKITVLVVTVGIRQEEGTADVYALARKLLDLV